MTCDINYTEIVACNSSPVSIDLTGSTSVAWAVGAVFTTANHTVRTVNGLEYKCILNHTATADDEPAVGVNFKTYWKLVARPWVEYIEFVDEDNHYRWFSDGSVTPPNVTRDLSQTGAPGDDGVQSSDASVTDIKAMDEDDWALETPALTQITFVYENE